MFKRPSSDDLDAALRHEAQRRRPPFDEALHQRVMANLPRAVAPAARQPRWAVWPRYALAATLVLALGLTAVVGSGWLQDRVRQRQARREAVASLSVVPELAVRTSPLRALGSAGVMMQGQWAWLDGDVRRQAALVRGHWLWQFMFDAPVAGAAEPSENSPDFHQPAGV